MFGKQGLKLGPHAIALALNHQRHRQGPDRTSAFSDTQFIRWGFFDRMGIAQARRDGGC